MVADRLVDQEQAPRAALRDQAADVLEAGDQASALGALPLARQALRPAGVRIVAGQRRRPAAGAAAAPRRACRRRPRAAPRRTARASAGRSRCGRRPGLSPSLPWRCHAQLGRWSVSHGFQSMRWPSISVQPEPDSMNMIASHEWRWIVVVDARVDLVQRGVEVLGRPVAVPAGVDARDGSRRAGDSTSCDVAALDDRLVVAAPLLEQRLAPLLLDLVVGDLGRGGRLHLAVSFSAGSGARVAGGGTRDALAWGDA